MATSTPQSLELLATYRSKIDVALRQFFGTMPVLLGIDLSAHSQQALDRLAAYAQRPGKRIRGSLAAAVYDDATHQPFSAVGIQLGLALELVQDYLLIIDDVMDKSALRRGQPALHTSYAVEAKAYGGQHEADMLAINIGVLAQHLANLVLTNAAIPPAVLGQVFAALHTNISATAFGQLDDLYQQLGRPVNEADILRKYRFKSSYYTFINPLQLGLTASGQATAETLESCKEFGEPAGIAFQLHDDYLGIFGNSELLGKSNLDDIQEGKYTLLVQYAVDHGKAADVQRLKTILGNLTTTLADLRTVQAIFTRAGAKDYTRQLTREYAAAAKQSLVRRPIGSQSFRELLGDVLDYSIERQT